MYSNDYDIDAIVLSLVQFIEQMSRRANRSASNISGSLLPMFSRLLSYS